uniref:Exonuclease domain-containing protein n=1 Tax=Echinostoma caproni TaxID=27848 RepID=A0A183AY57_9TREM
LRYPCCQSEVGQPGCQICPTGHVHEANKWLDNEGFVTTLPPLPSSLTNRDKGDEDADGSESDRPAVNIYALDCEMVYTTAGCELARCTIVDARLRTIMDCVVRPDHMVLDCNTRFSGLTVEQVEAAEMRITDVQSKLLHLFDSDSILIGHSLDSDLTALKLIHSKVVDTSVVFPHRLGPPKKRALRNLVGEYLHRIIQQGECGHNSLEDASACMELMQYKVKEDLRRGKWAFKKTV